MPGQGALHTRQTNLKALFDEVCVYHLSAAIVLETFVNNGLDSLRGQGFRVRFRPRRFSRDVLARVCWCFGSPPSNGGLVVAKANRDLTRSPSTSYKFDRFHADSRQLWVRCIRHGSVYHYFDAKLLNHYDTLSCEAFYAIVSGLNQAQVAQWQSTSMVRKGSWVQSPPWAPE
jgi:hypothetical protein